jgi:hypothetical protein
LEKSLRFAQRASPNRVAVTFEPMLKFHQSVAALSGSTVGETAVVTSILSQDVPITDLGWTAPITAEGIDGATGGPFSRWAPHCISASHHSS